MSIRLGVDGPNYQWYDAPTENKVKTIVLSQASELEVLIYGDNFFKYRLNFIDLIPEQNDENLKKLIMQDMPFIQELADKQPLEAAKKLLHWSSDHILYNSASHADTSFTTHKSASEIYYEHFASGLNGVYCGGSADFYSKVLHLFKIPAFTVDMGLGQPMSTHVVTIIPQENKAHRHWDFYLFDPTVNAYFEDSKGNMLSVADMYHVYKNNHSQMRPQQKRLPMRERQYIKDNALNCDGNNYIFLKYNNGYALCKENYKKDIFYKNFIDSVNVLPEEKPHLQNADDFTQFTMLFKGKILNLDYNEKEPSLIEKIFQHTVMKYQKALAKPSE